MDDSFIKDTMMLQPIITIGMIGHVSNGKSTITKAISGVATQKYSDEKERNITIKLGYANAKIWKCDICDEPECYQSSNSLTMELKCNICNNKMELKRHISITDCPGHNYFMSTMLNGTCSMDYVFLTESCANQIIPAPQTIEHYLITKEIGIQTALVCLNKTDLLIKTKNKAYDIINNIKEFVGKYEKTDIPIIPVSATLGCNIDVLCEYIAKLKIPEKNITDDFKMLIIRSFNINYPRTKIAEIKGGVIGGTLKRGIIKLDQDVIIYPGYISKNDNYDKLIDNKNREESIWQYKPLKCKVLSINTDKNSLKYAISGGQIGVQLNIDPCMTGDDVLVGQVVFRKEKNTDEIKIYEIIKIKYKKIKEELNINKMDTIQINVNSNNVKGIVTKIRSDYMIIELEKPICVELNDNVTINILPLDGGEGIQIYGSGQIIDGILSVCN